MANIANVKVGECQVFFYDTQTSKELDLGHSHSGAILTFERKFYDLNVDKYGSAPIDKALTGNNLKIEVTLAEYILQNLGLIIHEGVYAPGTGGDAKFGFGHSTGFLLSTRAGQLRLHPRGNAPSNLNDDIYIFKAVSDQPIALPYKIDEQRMYKVVFEALIDETKPEGYLLGRIGDDTIS